MAKSGRKSNIERAQIRVEEDKAIRYEEQEKGRARPIQIDTRVTLIGWLIGVAIGFGTSAVVSFNGITSVAGEVGLSYTWMQFLFFGFIEFMYLLFLVGYLVLDSRAEGTKAVQFGMWFFAGVGIYGNAFHTLKFHNWDWSTPELWTGLVLSVAAPIAILSISKLASRIVFSRAVRL